MIEFKIYNGKSVGIGSKVWVINAQGFLDFDHIAASTKYVPDQVIITSVGRDRIAMNHSGDEEKGKIEYSKMPGEVFSTKAEAQDRICQIYRDRAAQLDALKAGVMEEINRVYLEAHPTDYVKEAEPARET